jgi:polysaccharide deacetylase family protein (PEP-CTERM system associated)
MATWDTLPRRSAGVVPRILDFLARHDVKATFFVVGWLAEREPAMVRAIVEGGHEIASHSWEHALVGSLGPDGFPSSIRRSKQVLEEISGQPVRGYRAPSFSILPGMEWAFDILLEEGYRYDASLFPVTQHPVYGYPNARRHPYTIDRPSGTLVEIPATTLELLGRILPAAGGAYFRLLPLALVQSGFRQASRNGVRGTFYIHPWELDEWKPEVKAPALQKARTFWGTRRTWPRLERLFSEFSFGRVDATVEQLLAEPDPTSPSREETA